MKILQIFALVFIVWEIIKIFTVNFHWEQSKIEWNHVHNKNPKRSNIIFSTIEYIYLIFGIVLVFSHWWKFGLLLMALSFTTQFILFPFVKKDEKLNLRLIIISTIDNLLSIWILTNVINPLTLWH